ncbi:hypothetical protein SCP_0805130 [Sparassis crispa]|uniref:Uncharacterized protein n=1 Tax=Sparassis crispa TaxID=139825 RepID=A0A401GUY0_9APHY|nr:hypothetical protein SCP_0805130 [Sparassis crispa]GBE85989.1 hypothetical protein SCP_0805130 [Sparassis crispa]
MVFLDFAALLLDWHRGIHNACRSSPVPLHVHWAVHSTAHVLVTLSLGGALKLDLSHLPVSLLTASQCHAAQVTISSRIWLSTLSTVPRSRPHSNMQGYSTSKSERKYVELLYRASTKYSNWNPEVEVGDWGHITAPSSSWPFSRGRGGIFVKEGNIYEDGLAERYDVPQPAEYGGDALEGVTWLVSQNAGEPDRTHDVASSTPALASCRI